MLYYLSIYIYKIQNSTDGQEYSFGVFLDFRKAFDTANHKNNIVNETRTQLQYYGNCQ